MKLLVMITLCVLLGTLPAMVRAEGERPLTLEDMFRFQRVSDPQISPDGKQVVYVVTTVTDVATNKTAANLWLAAVDGKTPPTRLTTTDKKDRHPRWSPDGKRILFESSRSGENQLWVIDVAGGEARQLTTLSTEASTGIWSPDGMHIAFVSAVYPEFSTKPFKESDPLNKKRMEEIKQSPVKARVFTRLFYRHWDSYVEDKRQHLFVMSFANGQAGEPKDVTPGDRDAYPTSTTFSVGDDFTFSPDGKYLVFTAVPEKNEAWNTNHDLCRVPISGGTTSWECLTTDNPAADSGPQFSPDGKMVAYRAQHKPGYEADRWVLQVVATSPDGKFKGKPRELTVGLDRSVDSIAWMPDSSAVLFIAEEDASNVLFHINAQGGSATRILKGAGGIGSLSVGGPKAPVFCVSRAKLTEPAEVCVGKAGNAEASLRCISHSNDRLKASIAWPTVKSVQVRGAGDTPMQMWILQPPGFDAKKKWPLIYLVHGGPQGAWGDSWSYRWNPALWASQGYVVACPNPRGSTGFGQQYVDEISGDWGGKCYQDLMAGVAYMENQPYIDKDRMAAAGASFGGYMMNWFAVNTGKFKTLISHCGVYNFESMYATTEELWFDEWEHGGPPWGPNRESYEKHSPHRLAANLAKFRTPMLIIQNDLDFRVPVSEGQQLFTTLQRLGVKSKFINFPDEGHWVLKPANSKFWHEEVFAWLKKYVKPGGM